MAQVKIKKAPDVLTDEEINRLSPVEAPDVLTDEQINQGNADAPDVLTDEEINKQNQRPDLPIEPPDLTIDPMSGVKNFADRWKSIAPENLINTGSLQQSSNSYTNLQDAGQQEPLSQASQMEGIEGQAALMGYQKGTREYLNFVKELAKKAVAKEAYQQAGRMKAATLGYGDATSILERTPLADLSPEQKQTEFASGQLIGMAAPITAIAKGVGMGMKSVEAFNAVRPWLSSLFQEAVAGGVYGRAQKGGDWKKAADTAAAFMAFRGPFLALDRLMGKDILVPPQKAGEIFGKATESYAETLYKGGGHGGVMQPGRGEGGAYQNVGLPKGSQAKAEKSFWKTFIDESQKAIEEMKANRGEPGLFPSAYQGQGSPTVANVRVPTNFALTVRNIIKSLRNPSLTGKPPIWETEAIQAASGAKNPAQTAPILSPQGSTYLKTEFPVLNEAIKATPQVTPEIITSAVAAGIEAKLSGATGTQAETAAVKVLKEGAAAIPEAPKPIEPNITDLKSFRQAILDAFPKETVSEEMANQMTEMVKRNVVQWSMNTGRPIEEGLQRMFGAIVKGETAATPANLGMAQEDLFAIQKESVNDRYKRYAEEGKAVGLEGGALHKYALDRLAAERRSQLPTDRPKEKQIQFMVEGGAKAFGSDVPELFQDEGKVNQMAQDLVESKDAEEIDQKLDALFGTEAENAKIDAGEAPDNIQHRLAARFRADLEHAAGIGDVQETSRIMNRMMEVSRQAGAIEPPADQGERPSAKFIGYQEDGEGGSFPLFNVEGNHDLNGSTVSEVTLKLNGIPMPEHPSFEEWKKTEEGKLYQEEIKNREKVPLEKKTQMIEGKGFEFKDIKNRRFAYNADTDQMMLGGNNIKSSTHSQEMSSVGIRSSDMDGFLKGWVSGPAKSYPDGIIHFVPPVDNLNGPMGDMVLKTVQKFIQNGATGKTILRGFPGKWEQSIQDALPEFTRPGGALFQRQTTGDIRKPQSVGELAENIFGREVVPMLPLKGMDGGMLSMLKHDQVGQAVVSNLPVDVMDILKTSKASPEDLIRNPSVVITSLPVDKRSPVALGILESTRSVGAGLRAKLSDGLTRRVDVDLLPTLKASDLTSREIVGVFSPQSIYHARLGEVSGNRNITSPRTKEGDIAALGEEILPTSDAEFLNKTFDTSDRTITGHSETARTPGMENNTATIAEAIGWHDSIIHKMGISSQGRNNKIKASVEFMEDGRAIITAFSKADFSSLVHEIGHVFRREMYRRLKEYKGDALEQLKQDIAEMEKFTGGKGVKWGRNAEEKFARSFERYLITGKAPTQELQHYYDMFRDWMRQVYGSVKGTAIDIKLSPEIKGVFDRMFDDGYEYFENGEKVKKSEIVKRAQEMAELSNKEIRVEESSLERYFRENPIKVSKADRADYGDIPVRFLDNEGLGLDVRAKDAKTAGLIPEGVDAEKYAYEFLTGIPERGGLARASMFYDDALREFAYEKEAANLFQETAANDPRDTADKDYKLAGDKVDGRTVGKRITNTSSIGASLTQWEELDGVRDIPISAFEDSGKPSFYSRTEEDKVKSLAEEIKESKHIDPLIVVIDRKGPYVLEGGHRFDALKLMGAKSFPALVVIDETPNALYQEENQIDTPAFKKWFGDWKDPKAHTSRAKGPVSYAVDEDGKPLRLFHTTREGFSTFETGRPTKNSWALGSFETNRHGIFATPDPEFSAEYGGNRPGARMMPIFMNIKYPIDLRMHRSEDAYIDDLVAEGINERWFRNIQDQWELFDGENGKIFVEAAKRAGYDGVIITELNENRDSRDTYVAFEPTQIKSATGNRGTFDPENPNILYQEEPVTPGELPDDIYKRNRELSKDKKSAVVKPILESAARQVEAIMTPISHVLKNIDPSIRSALRRNAYNEGIRTMEDTNAVVPFLHGVRMMRREHKADMDLALKNGDIQRVEGLVEKYGLTDEFNKARRMLNEVHRRAKEVGFDIGYLQDYWPRAVKDKEGFLAYVGKDPRWPDISALLKIQEEIKGSALSAEDKIAVINMYLRGYSNAMLTLSKTQNMKRRLIETVTPELNKFYYDSSAAMMNYIRTANRAIEARRFFGRGAKEMWKENLDESIGGYVLDLVEKGVIKKAGQDKRLKDALGAYFNQKGMHGFFAGVKDLSVATTMGNLISALTQLGDIGFSAYRAPFQTMQALAQAIVGRSNIKLKDLGLHDIASELADTRKSAEVVGKIMEASLLPMFDRIMSETFINAVLKKYSIQAKKKAPALMERIRAAFGRDRMDVVRDLEYGHITDDVKFLAFSELLGIQPKALTELPEVFLRGGNARIFYLLKTFIIRQLDFIREEVFDKVQEPGLQSKGVALGRLIGIVTAMMAVGVSRDEIKDWILRRKTTFKDHIIDNLWQLIGASKWMVYKAREEGLGSAVMKNILPPAPWIDYPTKDIRNMGDGKGLESTQLIPNIGKLYYWWFGRGANKKTGWRGAKKKIKGGIGMPKVGIASKGIKVGI